MKALRLASTIGILLAAASCDSRKPPAAIQRDTPSAAADPAIQQILSAKPSGETVAIPQARLTAKPGDEITLKGRIMGSTAPFVAERAAFTLGDTATLSPCTDGCASPWDNCCDAPEARKSGTALIQIVDGSGKVLKEGLEGQGGLAKLSHVTVTGKVAEGSSADLLLINAAAISVDK